MALLLAAGTSGTTGPRGRWTTPSDAGADAVSFHINVGSQYEPEQIEELSELTTEASQYGLPVLAMAYARGPDIDSENEDYNESVGHAVRRRGRAGHRDDFTSAYETFQHAAWRPVWSRVGHRRVSIRTDEDTVRMVRGTMDAGASGVPWADLFSSTTIRRSSRAVSPSSTTRHHRGSAPRSRTGCRGLTAKQRPHSLAETSSAAAAGVGVIVALGV